MRLRLRKDRTRADSESAASHGTPPGQSSEVFYDVAMRRLEEQLERRESYASRVAAALTVGATILPVTSGLLTLDGRHVPTCALIFLYGSIVVFVTVVVFCLIVLLPGTLDFRPDMPTLVEHSRQQPTDAVRRWVANECVESIRRNDERLGRTVVYVSAALIALGIETVLLAVAAVLVIS